VNDLFKELQRPFDKEKVSWRVGMVSKKNQKKGRALAYIDARDVMNRLDSVVGPENWQDAYSFERERNVRKHDRYAKEYYFEDCLGRCTCQLSLRIDGEWITKSDSAGETATEGEKGAVSDAFKRAAVKFGIGRYLYSLPSDWVDLDDYKKIVKPPSLPNWALPDNWDAVWAKKYGRTMMDALRDNFDSVAFIRTEIATGNIDAAREAFNEIDQGDQQLLFKATTKGGIFTTEERRIIKEGK
jgi:hypothetical protein